MEQFILPNIKEKRLRDELLYSNALITLIKRRNYLFHEHWIPGCGLVIDDEN